MKPFFSFATAMVVATSFVFGSADVIRGTNLCVRAAVATDPELPSKVYAVTVHATGSAEQADVTITPAVGSQPLQTCMTRKISDALGGDPQPVTLTFSIRVQVDKP